MKITEEQLRNIIRESLEKLCEEGNIEEGFLGLSLDNRVKNGRWRENPNGKNPVIRTAYVNGWELFKPDEENIEGVKHPKASWPMLIAMLNKELRPHGYTVSGANYRESRLDLNDNETNDGYGAKTYMGTIIVRKG